MQPFLLDGRPTATAPTRLVEDPADLAPLSPARFRPIAGARVVDLSSLWAGPLATSLLSDAGAEVIKVESTGRPDGARSGPTAFFDLLHAGKRSVALDLPDPVAVAHLQALVDDADLVVEASRPRALDQLGIVRHLRWLTLTAYGATGPWRQWSGFGDDAAVAGGLVSGTSDAPAFYGDAVADPLAGLYAAAVALAVLVGEPASVDLALREVANHVVGDAPPGPPLRAGARRHRPGAAPALGEGNHDLLRPADAPAARAR
jgi:crotonobetainyl-CoA:carnitine CoA-transferase CaiB-like acyl-CoA transferase